MIRRVYERALRCRCLREVYIATDDNRIYSAVRKFGGRAVMTGTSHRSGTDRVCEAAETLGLGPGEVVVNIQGDQPAFPPSVIDELVEPFESETPPSMTTLMYKIRKPEQADDPNQVKVVTDSLGNALYFSRSPIPHQRDGAGFHFHKHLGFYAYRVGFLKDFKSLPEGRLEAFEKLEQLRALEYGFRVRVIETGFDSVEVDVPGDIARVEAHLASEE